MGAAAKRLKYPVMQTKGYYDQASVVTPSDTIDLVVPAEALMVQSTINVQVTMADGTVVLLYGLFPGVIYPLLVTRVWATNTGAGKQILALNCSF